MTMHARSTALAAAVAAGLLAVAVVAVPVLGQAAPPPSDAAAAPAASDTPGKGAKPEKVAKTPVTLTGTVGTRTDADGSTVYTLASGGTTYDLEAGPPWFWGDAHPLKGLVGKTVTVTGEQAAGGTQVDVLTADGKTIRAAGKPAWAGGWKRVGSAHPGWSQEKADRMAAKEKAGHGRPSWAGPKEPKASDDADD